MSILLGHIWLAEEGEDTATELSHPCYDDMDLVLTEWAAAHGSEVFGPTEDSIIVCVRLCDSDEVKKYEIERQFDPTYEVYEYD